MRIENINYTKEKDTFLIQYLYNVLYTPKNLDNPKKLYY